MRSFLIFMTLLATGFYSCGQSDQPTPDKAPIDLKKATIIEKDKNQSPPIINPSKDVYTEYKDTAADGKGIIVQNSYPRGGGDIDGERGYTDANGKSYAHAIFWTRVVNNTDTSIKLEIDFPADSLAVFASPDAYLKLFLPTSTMSVDKRSSFNYGIVGLRSFLNNNFNTPPSLRKTIQPNEEYLFYTVMLSYEAGGTPRAEFLLKDQALSYKASITPHGATTIPCGQIISELE